MDARSFWYFILFFVYVYVVFKRVFIVLMRWLIEVWKLRIVDRDDFVYFKWVW